MFNNISEAIAYLREEMLRKIKRGKTECPCCGKNQELYTIKLSRTMVKGLLHLSKDYKQGEEFHLTDYFFKLQHPEIKSAADASIYKLTLFGLIEDAPSGAKGYYVYTQKATDFLTGNAWIPFNVTTYNNNIVDVSKNTHNIKSSLKPDFNYPSEISWSLKV